MPPVDLSRPFAVVAQSKADFGKPHCCNSATVATTPTSMRGRNAICDYDDYDVHPSANQDKTTRKKNSHIDRRAAIRSL